MQLHRRHDVDSPEFAFKARLPVLRNALHAFGWAIVTCILCFAILFVAKALLPLEILKRFGAGQPLSVFIGSILWGVVHYLSGGLLHAIVALGSGAMFSFVYLRYREPGVAAAYATTAFARACNNALLLIAVAYGVDA